MFKKGESGCPTGKPRGSGKWQKFWKQITQDDIAQLVDALKTEALSGNVAAMKLILDRVSPPLRAVDAPMTFELPDGSDLAGKATAILEAAAAGKLPANVAGGLMAGLAGIARLKDADEFEARIRACETRLQGNGR